MSMFGKSVTCENWKFHRLPSDISGNSIKEIYRNNGRNTKKVVRERTIESQVKIKTTEKERNGEEFVRKSESDS